MKMSDIVASYIMKILDESDGNAEIQRNELAGELGCVPSQINYVITSRFTPEQGYMVESKRGGGGYIKITRIKMDRNMCIMHVVNCIGDRINSMAASAILQNMQHQNVINIDMAKLIAAALSDRAYICVPLELRDNLRASILKNMLLTQI